MENIIEITKNAQKHIASIMTSENSNFFRITVLGGGCAGFQYKFDFDNNNFSAALASFNSILDLHPKNVEAMFYRANTLTELGRVDEAIQIYTSLLSAHIRDNICLSS